MSIAIGALLFLAPLALTWGLSLAIGFAFGVSATPAAIIISAIYVVALVGAAGFNLIDRYHDARG